MKQLSSVLVAVLVAVLFLLLASACLRPPTSPEELKKKAIDRASSLSTYRATLETEMFLGAMQRMVGAPDAGPDDVAALKGTATIDAWLPDRMWFSVSITDPRGEPMRFDSVYDGANAWVSASSGVNAQHHRVDQKLAAPGRPFDVGFNMRGGGLLEGEDLKGSVLWILNTWNFTSTNQTKACTELKGTIDMERAVDATLGAKGEKVAPLFAPENKEAFASQRTMMAEMMGRGLSEMREATICVSKDGDVVGWLFGDGKSLLQKVTVTKFERDVPIAIERFNVDEKVKSEARDVSDVVRQSRAAPPVDPKELDAFRKAILAATTPTRP